MDLQEQFDKVWPAIKKAPALFTSVVIGLAAIGWGLIYWHYAAVIEGKDATIQAKDAVIESKESTIVANEKALQSIQQTVSAKDDLIVSLTNQYVQMLSLQSQLNTQYLGLKILHSEVSHAQSNLLVQEKKLSDVEYVVKDLFSRMTSETIAGSDSGRVVLLRDNSTASNSVSFAVKLSAVPIRGSLQMISTTLNADGKRSQITYPVIQSPVIAANLVFLNATNFDYRKAMLTFIYAKESSPTNFFDRVERFDDDVLILNGEPLRINTGAGIDSLQPAKLEKF